MALMTGVSTISGNAMKGRVESPCPIKEDDIDRLAIFGGAPLFPVPKSTSNLLQPDIDAFLGYSRMFFEQKRYTNNGPVNRLLEKRLAEFHQTRYCVTFSSGFWALVLAMRALALEGKTEIIMPSLTYRRMPDMAAWLHLKPRFCEVDPDSLAMSPETVRSCINENTALILGTHPIVNCCDAKGLVDLAKEHNIPILFDAVESVYESTAAGRVGGFGEAECFSLHACKLLNGFGGGYLTTNNQALAARLAAMRGFGFAGIDNVNTPDGMNAKLNEMHAAMALASLDDVENQIALNRERYYTYKSALGDLQGLRLLEFDERYRSGYKNIVAEVLESWPLSREATIRILNAENILARPHYYPALHRKPMDFPHVAADLPVTDRLAERFINLPCGQRVCNEDIVMIVDFMRFIADRAGAIAERLGRGGVQ